MIGFPKIAAIVIALALLSCCSSAMAKYSTYGKLRVGYYAKTCPQAESIVRNVVYKAISKDPGTAPELIRLFFHDCFVRGCDASVLLDTVKGKAAAEKDNIANNPSLGGFDVIDKAKALIEAKCPRTVSCADIVAFAARDGVFKAGNIGYEVAAGRRDGRVSLSSKVLLNLPAPFFNATQLRDGFLAKGFSLDEMVTLSGAHSIGDAHCSSFASRLYNFNSTFKQDPSMDPKFAAFLKTKCPRVAGKTDPAVDNDIVTPNRLDNRYYLNLKNHRGLFSSDQILYDSPMTRNLVKHNAKFGKKWAKKFAAAMVKMGNLDVLAGKQGEIRKNCHFVN